MRLSVICLRPVSAALLVAVISLVMAPVAMASSEAVTTTYKVTKDNPPPESFMKEGSINPTDRDLTAGVADTADTTTVTAPPPVAAAELGAFVVGQAAPSYRTLGDAAKAGVNPMDKPKPAAPVVKAAPIAAKPADLAPAKVWWTYLLEGLSAVILVFVLYVVFTARLRKTQDKA